MEEYMKLALADIKEEAEWTMNRLKDIADGRCIERYWVHEEFMKAMRDNPSVLRTQLVLAMLQEHDASAVEKLRADFERVSAHYPYPVEVETEREYIRLAEEKAAAGEAQGE